MRAPAPAQGARVLFDADEIQAVVGRMADSIRAVYRDEEVLVVTVLHGGLVFTADLIRRLDMPLRLASVSARSYRGSATEPGPLLVHVPEEAEIVGRHVLLVDDILDTGRTLTRLREEVATRGAASVRIAALVDKPSRRLVPIQADFCGFTIPDLFVIGYGLDWNGRYRNLPYIAALDDGSG